MAKHKRTKATEFSGMARARIHDRDWKGCIFCARGYHTDELSSYERGNFQIMHYIPRSQGGLGIEQNGAVGCIGHHKMLDNGSEGRRDEMMVIFKNYLKAHYSDWSESGLVFNKFKDLEV